MSELSSPPINLAVLAAAYMLFLEGAHFPSELSSPSKNPAKGRIFHYSTKEINSGPSTLRLRQKACLVAADVSAPKVSVPVSISHFSSASVLLFAATRLPSRQPAISLQFSRTIEKKEDDDVRWTRGSSATQLMQGCQK
jgi:hypothetical protein